MVITMPHHHHHLSKLLLFSFNNNKIPTSSSFSISITSSPITSSSNSSNACFCLSTTNTHKNISKIVTTTIDQQQQDLTLDDICKLHVPHHILRRVEEVGYLTPTEIQRQALPVLFTGRDCILHAQTGSGKTLAYLLLIFSVINIQRSAVQALIVVPTRELGMQVAKVARMLAAKSDEPVPEDKSCTIMALLDGGTLRRQKSWLKAEPPTIVVATLGSLCQMLEKQMIKLESMKVLVIDEVDFMFNSPHQSEKSKKAGNAPAATVVIDALKNSH